MRKLILFAATGGGSGYFPGAPGTAGAGVGLGLYALLVLLPWRLEWSLPLALAGVAAGGSYVAGRAEALWGRRDDPRITVDEVAGMLAALVFLPPRVEVAALAFLLFRALDIWKPGPVRRAESLPGGLGVMADDLLAGACANLAGQLLWRVACREG
jgi:phosphatidylglycerophosphatase A